MPRLLVSAWAPDGATALLCLAAPALYFIGFRAHLGVRAGSFVAAVGVFFVALASPIGVLARGYLFSAHMLQHLLLILVVPPLALLGLPREPDSPGPSREPDRGFWAHALPWLAGTSAMWLWHERSLCNAAAASDGVRWIQTTSLVALGGVFWWPILAPRDRARFAPFAAIVYLFTACLACTALGILVTFSPVEVCSIYAHPVDRLGVLPLLRSWGLSPDADQRLGGLMMWVPACLVYTAAILGTLARYYRGDALAAPTLASRPVAGGLE